MTKKKPFIDKKKAVRFYLSNERVDSEDVQDGYDWKGEAVKFGIEFDDQYEYDYMQHLREIGRSPNAVWIEAKENNDINTSNHEEGNELPDEKPKNKESEDIDEVIDPEVEEIMDALDDDAYINEFDDEFIQQLCENSEDEYYSEDREDDWDNISEQSFAKTAFTGVSMTSASVYRNENLTFLDDRFDKFIGNYDSESSEEFTDDFESDDEECRVVKDQYETLMEEMNDHANFEEMFVSKLSLKDIVFRDEYEFQKVNLGTKYDCETILSAFSSNTMNRPKVIRLNESQRPNTIKLSSKTGIPIEAIKVRPVKEKPSKSTPIERKKDETKEERKERKRLVKESKRARKVEKKETKKMFKQELLKQQKLSSIKI